MSDFQAVGGVSVSLKSLLEDRMDLPDELHGHPSRATVTVSTPGSEKKSHDVEEEGQNTKTARINLFLYRVTENGSLKNQEIPGYGDPGTYGHPPLSLDLHYVLTAYGATPPSVETGFVDESVAHYLLGSAMRVLHDYPVITKQLRTIRHPAGEQILHPSLTEEFEQVKLYLDPISLEDLSKVWTALMLSYRLSVAYKVTVVQIESQRIRRFPKLVGEPPPAGPRVYAIPFQTPQIQEVHVRRTDDPDVEQPYPYARTGDTLVIRGRNFGGRANVLLGGLTIPATPQSDDLIELTVPDENLPDATSIPEEQRLQPGALPVSVAPRVPGLSRTGLHSNQAVFMLVPIIAPVQVGQTTKPKLSPNLTQVPQTLTIRGRRLYLGNLSGETLVGSAVMGKDSYVNPTSTEITVPLPDTLPARLVHCLVSGEDLPTPLDNQVPTLAIQVKIGNVGPHTATLAETPMIESIADMLQAAIRAASYEDPEFRGTRVTMVTMVGNRLVVVPGGLFNEVSMLGPVAKELKLSTDPHDSSDTWAEQIEGAYLSGELDPFPALTAVQPSLKVTMGNHPNTQTHTVSLASRPTTLADAAKELEKAVTGISAPAFQKARVTVLEKQLLILPGAPSETTNFEAVPVGDQDVPSGDQTTAAELQLRARYPVRVRVNGVENIPGEDLEMPS